MVEFLRRLFFTRDDDLDAMQLLFVVVVIFDLVAVAMDSSGAWVVSGAAWAFLGTVFATLVLTAVPRWVAELIARSKLPVEVGGMLAKAEPNVRRDDESGK